MTKEEQAQAKAREIAAELAHDSAHIPALMSVLRPHLLSAERDGYRRGVQAMQAYSDHIGRCRELRWRTDWTCTCGLDAAKGGE